MNPDYPCPACGFMVFDEPPGSFVICPVCDWEDDYVQAADPLYQGGANGISLADHQQAVLRKYPLNVQEHGEYRRDPRWKPVETGS
jgi:uncharacterized Zn finger protein (UPF0148 family)